MNVFHSFSKLPLILALFICIGVAGEVQAQYFSFGKNRVQYDDFNWRYIQSDHFDVYYYESKNYGLANFTAITLEAALQQLQEDFQHGIADRIQVIIYDSHNDFSQTNVVLLPVDTEGIGGVTDLYKNRITMPFEGDYAKFRSTLHHELVHAVINDMYYGGSIQSIISGGNQVQIPIWFNEGLSEYESLGWDTETDMWMRDAVINNYLPPLSQLGGYFAYRGGQSFWNYIVEEYGREKIGEILQTLRTQRTMDATFQRTLGLSLEEVSERWQDYYEKRYFPEVAEREQIKNFSTLITERGKFGSYNTSPSVSPQGDKIAMITNARGFFDVIVISAVTGEKIKTLIKGSDNVIFEELNILNPNLSWSPDGTKITLSTKTKGEDNLAIVDYNTGEVQKIRFPRLDAIGSVAWSPDGKKIAFDANYGTFQDIFVYDLETQDFTNVTNDVISDYEPAWSGDSKTIYFTSARGDNVQLNRVKNNESLLASDYMYTTDIYAVTLGSSRATRLTKTPVWNETQAATTRAGQLLFVSDQNGIPNVYQMNLSDRTVAPLTNLQTGVMQMSVSADGSRLAVNSINEGYLDIFLVRSPLLRKKKSNLSDNHWAQRRVNETKKQRVPAVAYVQRLLDAPGPPESEILTGGGFGFEATADTTAGDPDTTGAVVADTTGSDGNDSIDFRNYVFAREVEEDTVFKKKYLDEAKFEPDDNRTEDGRYQPRDYRLKFTTDLAYAGGSFSTYYGSYGLTQIMFSDLLGNHQIVFGSNLVFDLRNSDYYLQYGYFKKRTNWLFNFFHSSNAYQTFSGQLLRFRSFGGGINARYPIDKFRRLDFGISMINLSQDYSIVGREFAQNENSTFAYPQVIYTQDKTLPGFITPRAGSRFSTSLSASPPLSSQTQQFVSALGDYRKYFNLGYRYTVALRGSGGASFGRDSQTYFMGGMLGWINQKWSGNSLPIDRLGDTFFTLPALPLRGHEYNAIYGDRFSLVNAEFRFPLFAAILPGPIPILPLYNLTGVAFVDAGMAWGQKVAYYEYENEEGDITEDFNSASLDFSVQNDREIYIDRNNREEVLEERPLDFDENPNQYINYPAGQGDILIGAGFGLRTILLGLPFRYDIGWPYFRDGFDGKPIHYFTIGIDF